MKYLVTGMICSGKSIFLDLAKEANYSVLKADEIVAELYTDSQIIEKLKLKFSNYNFDGDVKETISNIFFTSKDNMDIIEEIIHPYVYLKIETYMKNHKYIMVELPLLRNNIEYFLKHKTIYIDSEEEMRRDRFQKYRNKSLDYFNFLNNIQSENLEIKNKCDIIIKNNGSKDDLHREYKNKVVK